MPFFYICIAVLCLFLGAYVGISVKEIVDKVRSNKSLEKTEVKESDATENNSEGK